MDDLCFWLTKLTIELSLESSYNFDILNTYEDADCSSLDISKLNEKKYKKNI